MLSSKPLRRFPVDRIVGDTTGKKRRERRLRPCAEALDSRCLLTASLAPIAAQAAPSLQGLAVPLDGSGTTDAQTFTVTSSNPDIAATAATGPFWTMTLSHTGSIGHGTDVSFTGSIVFQLFNDLTPMTVSEFETFIGDNYYIGKDITRIVKDFSGPGNGDYVFQGGAPNPDGSGNSGQPGTPYGVELLQQLAFTGPGTLAVANTGAADSNDTQFFIDTAAEPFLNYGYTLFGQVVSGQNILNDLKNVALMENTSTLEDSQPISPVTITASTLTTTNPNGVVHIDTTQAKPGETSTITVTATDSVDKTTTSRSFLVTVGAYSGPTDPPLNFRPFASPVGQRTPGEHRQIRDPYRYQWIPRSRQAGNHPLRAPHAAGSRCDHGF